MKKRKTKKKTNAKRPRLLAIALVAVIGISIAAAIYFGGGESGNSSGSSNPNGGKKISIEMVLIKPGTFMMGSPANEPGRYGDETQHQVTLTGFYMGKYEVTQAQYEAVMGSNPSFDKRPASPETSTANRPVEQVNWYSAIVFCNKLSMQEGLSPAYRIPGFNNSTDPAAWGTVPKFWNDSAVATWDGVEIVGGSNGYRLPTEAQWEYACRAGTTTAYNTGDTISDDTGWYAGNTGRRTHEVGEKPPNAWGLYDMHGNVSEWCWDWAGNYSSGAQTDPMGAVSGGIPWDRMERGGAWSLSGHRSAHRTSSTPSYGGGSSGFRVVRPL
jgi:formylglycine-generating enzyme required for sulfatase activity